MKLLVGSMNKLLNNLIGLNIEGATMKVNFLKISLLLLLTNIIRISGMFTGEDENIQAFKFLRRMKSQPNEELLNSQEGNKKLRNEASILITQENQEPLLENSSILGKKYIYLEALEVKRKLVVKGAEDFFAVISDLPGKQLHVFDNIYAGSCNLLELLPAFFREKIEADKVFIIKDLVCKSINKNIKLLENLESILIERRLKSHSHKIMFKYKNSNECRICYWNEIRQSLTSPSPISCAQKDQEQTQLVREFWKTRN